LEIPVAKRILFEDNHIIAVNKLPGELVQGDFTGDVPLLEKVREYIRVTYNKPGNVFTGLVHRLDRPTSGIVIFAKTSKALSRLNAMFEKRDVEKIYWAIVQGTPDKKENKLVHYLKKDQKKNKSQYFFKEVSGAKKAVLSYSLLKKMDYYSLLEIKLETGRHHQIRVQLSSIGCPIKGDLKYGFSRSNKDGSVCLHARKAIFVHPVSGDKIELEAPLPTGENTWKYANN
jgi:23S rRNA pseudouridine1911/1915/1917 synthase